VKIRIFVTVVLVTGLLLFFGIRFVSAVQEDEWKIQRSAVQTAYEKTILTKAIKMDRFVGEKPYSVIQGEDKIGNKVVVWVGDDNIYTQMASEGLSVEEIKMTVLSRHPEAEIVRLMPGILNGNFVWEAFYKVAPEDSGNGRYYYDYYLFKDGTYIDTYRLSIQ
jgi:uncharacterized protein YpmB